VHIGADDGNLAEIRSKIGKGKLLGASCYNRLDLALAAAKAGVDYVAFGACFASSTKPNAPVADLSLFELAKAQLSIPTVAIGGISLANAGQAIAAGASSVAVIHAIFNADDVKLSAQKFTQLFSNQA
jgi:thiamine-phosphate pyrophosphorylase